MTENQIAMLLSAILSATMYNNKDAATSLTGAGLRMLKAKTDTARIDVWREIETLAGWTGGFSNE